MQIGGYDFLVDPLLDAPAAPVFWNPKDAPAIVNLVATLPDVGVKSVTASALPSVDREAEPELTWLRLHDGTVIVGADVSNKKPIGILLPLDEDWSIRFAAADRLRRTLERLPADSALTQMRRERLKRALRTVDGLRVGANYRAVAIAFFGEARVADEPWKTSALKAQVARLARHGRMLIDHGYRELISGKFRLPKHASDIR